MKCPASAPKQGLDLAAGLSARALKVRVRSGELTAVRGPVPVGIGGDRER